MCMGGGKGFCKHFILTIVSCFCTTVHAVVVKEAHGPTGYEAQGYKVVSSPCNMAGIAQDYANKEFLKAFLPPDRQEGLREVVWNPNTKIMQVLAKDNYTLVCEENTKNNYTSLMCRFNPVPKGVKFLWFKITRVIEDGRCVETGVSQGQFGVLVKVKGYTPEGLHEQVSSAFLAPYRESVNRQSLKQREHALGVVKK